MPPPLLQLLRFRDDITTTSYGDGAEEGYNQKQPWVIPVIVGSVILVTGLAVYAYIFYTRRSEYRKAQEKEPYLTRSEFAKRRKMSEADRLEEEEKQRIIMIRKSLASRSWDSAASSASSRRVSGASADSEPSQPEPSQHISRVPTHRTEVTDDDGDEPRPLREDWKAWEARMQHQMSLARHPAADSVPGQSSPREASKSRSRSPSRSPLLMPPTPPVPPRNPNRDSG